MVANQPWKERDGSVIPPWTFHRYLENVVLPDPSIGTTYKALKACSEVDRQFQNVTPGEVVGVEDEHWAFLTNAIEAPKGSGIHPGILRQFLPFMDAVLEAKKSKEE
jgi:hypothetical protein